MQPPHLLTILQAHSIFFKVSAGIWTWDPWNQKQVSYQLSHTVDFGFVNDLLSEDS
jgi:hypothetical protein